MAALYSFDIIKNRLYKSPVDTGFSTSHNVVLDKTGKQLYITHSGAASNTVTYYRIGKKNGQPVFEGVINVGLNPFGLTFVG